MAKLSARERGKLPDRAFAYIDSRGARRLPIHDEAHVRNALARFERVAFEDPAARERARRRLLSAAKRYGIVPVGFITGQLRVERSLAAAGRVDPAIFPTGFVTFLLTDIEGSTRLVTALGDRYAALLKDVRNIVRSAVVDAGGIEVEARADEFFGAFARPRPAIEAAVTMQLELGERSWPDDAQCRVRVGIHSGRPTLTDTGYIGLAVHTAARICDAGHGGQIVVSGQTRTALRGSPPSGVRLTSLGRHRLAGLARAQNLFQVGATGLLTDFPPLRG